ncbi:36478_t:CDS:2, partial [Racocetra persica]
MQDQYDAFFEWAKYKFNVTDEFTARDINAICHKLKLENIFEENEEIKLANIELQWICIKLEKYLELNNNEITHLYTK